MGQTSAVDIMQRLQEDYARFPKGQSYDIYADDVYFKDPMNSFKGVTRYQKMIGFIERWFQEPQLDLQSIEQTEDNVIKTHWILHFTAPMPWRPRISIPGWSEMALNSRNKIVSHIDYWKCSRTNVFVQLWRH